MSNSHGIWGNVKANSRQKLSASRSPNTFFQFRSHGRRPEGHEKLINDISFRNMYENEPLSYRLSPDDMKILHDIFDEISVEGKSCIWTLINEIQHHTLIIESPCGRAIIKEIENLKSYYSSSIWLDWTAFITILSRTSLCVPDVSSPPDITTSLLSTRYDYQKKLDKILGYDTSPSTSLSLPSPSTSVLSNQLKNTAQELITLRNEVIQIERERKKEKEKYHALDDRIIGRIEELRKEREREKELEKELEREREKERIEKERERENEFLEEMEIEEIEERERETELIEKERQKEREIETEKEKEKEIEREKERMKNDAYNYQLNLRLQPLNDQALHQVKSALSLPHNDTLLIEKFCIPMTRYKLSCLRPCTWLNDEVINFYLNLLKEREDRRCAQDMTRRQSWYFSSFFMEKLLETDKKYNFANVKRWSKKFDVFAMEKIFFPINQKNTHWTLAVIFVQQKRIRYYDSMAGAGDKYLQALLRYISDESKAKRQKEINPEEWELVRCTHNNTSQQENGVDCGVYTTMFADFVTDDLCVMSLPQKDIHDYRKKICYSILKGELLYD